MPLQWPCNGILSTHSLSFPSVNHLNLNCEWKYHKAAPSLLWPGLKTLLHTKVGDLGLWMVQNFSGVTDMGGGYSAWKESGLPVQTHRAQQARKAWICSIECRHWICRSCNFTCQKSYLPSVMCVGFWMGKCCHCVGTTFDSGQLNVCKWLYITEIGERWQLLL
jgi:hypothetical protein